MQSVMLQRKAVQRKVVHFHTLKTGIPVKEGDSILKLLRRVSRPEIQLGVGIHSELDLFFKSGANCLLSNSGSCLLPRSCKIS